MGKKIFTGIFAIILIATSVLSLALMYRNDNKYNLQLDPDKIGMMNRDVNDIWQVGRTSVIVKLNSSSVIAPSNQDALKTVSITGKKEAIALNLKVGDIIDKNFVFAKKSNTEFKASSRMKCISITWEDDTCNVIFLDYSKLYIEAKLPYHSTRYDLFSLLFSFSSNGETFNGDLIYLDYVIENDTILAKFKYENEDILLLPGTKVTLDTALNKKENVIAIPTLFVMVRGDEYFAQVLGEDESIKIVPIQIGAVGIDNVEILSGISENDNVLCPNEEQSLSYQLSQREQGESDAKN